MYHFKTKNDSEQYYFDIYLNYCFNFGKKFQQRSFISTVPFRISPSLVESVSSNGFSIYERFSMTLQLSECSFQEPDLNGFSIQSNIGDYTNEIIELIMSANKNQIDAKIFPDFSDFTIMKRVLGFEEPTNHSFSEEASVLLFKNSKLIGLNLIQFQTDSTALVFELAIDPKFRRRKLGSRLMVCSILVLKDLGMKELILNVSAGNPAQIVYESIGFKIQKNSYTTVLRKDYVIN